MEVKAWDVLIIFGIVIGIFGCFSPWGRNYPTLSYPEQYAVTGTSFASGIFALIGLVSATIFQLVFMFKRKVYMIFAVLISGLLTLLFSENWIRYPSYYFEPAVFIPIIPPGVPTPPTALYGSYVTLLGAAIVSGMAFLYIVATARKQQSERSKQKIRKLPMNP